MIPFKVTLHCHGIDLTFEAGEWPHVPREGEEITIDLKPDLGEHRGRVEEVKWRFYEGSEERGESQLRAIVCVDMLPPDATWPGAERVLARRA